MSGILTIRLPVGQEEKEIREKLGGVAIELGFIYERRGQPSIGAMLMALANGELEIRRRSQQYFTHGEKEITFEDMAKVMGELLMGVANGELEVKPRQSSGIELAEPPSS